MNVNDTEVVWSILKAKGYSMTTEREKADLWLLVTCSIREGAENKIWRKLEHIKLMKKAKKYNPDLKVGLLGCMAERLKKQLLEGNRLVDVVAGPGKQF
jgi:tRNA A37 methylthiotransferase MiaB